jgi:hypothetical protein
MFCGISLPSKRVFHIDKKTVVHTNTFEFDSNGLMIKRIVDGDSVWTYEYIDKK